MRYRTNFNQPRAQFYAGNTFVLNSLNSGGKRYRFRGLSPVGGYRKHRQQHLLFFHPTLLFLFQDAFLKLLFHSSNILCVGYSSNTLAIEVIICVPKSSKSLSVVGELGFRFFITTPRYHNKILFSMRYRTNVTPRRVRF